MIIFFVKIILRNGLKESSELTMHNVFRNLKRITKKSPYITFKSSLDKAKVYSEIKSVKISGRNYKVPVEIKPRRQLSLVFKWMTFNSSKVGNYTKDISLMKELLNTCVFNSKTIKKCNDFHKIAESNKIYMHYRY